MKTKHISKAVVVGTLSFLVSTVCCVHALAGIRKVTVNRSQKAELQNQTDIEARKELEKRYIDKVFVKCGEGVYGKYQFFIKQSGNINFVEPRLLEILDFKLTVRTNLVKSPTDKRNGIEARGTAAIGGTSKREYNPKTRVWSEYKDFYLDSIKLEKKNGIWSFDEFQIGVGVEYAPDCNEVEFALNSKSIEQEKPSKEELKSRNILDENRANATKFASEAREEAAKLIKETFSECRPNRHYAKFEVSGFKRKGYGDFDYTQMEIYEVGFFEITELKWNLTPKDATEYVVIKTKRPELAPFDWVSKTYSPNLWEGNILLSAKSYRYFVLPPAWNSGKWSENITGIKTPCSTGGGVRYDDATARNPDFLFNKMKEPNDGEKAWHTNMSSVWKPIKDCSEINKLL